MVMKYATIGLQNGDEGKGKITKYLSGQAGQILTISQRILTYRWQGGKNAGHTTYVGDEKFQLHQVPSAVTNDNIYCLLGTGMFIHIRKLYEEMTGLMEKGIRIDTSKIGISSKAHVTLDYHVDEDMKSYNLPEHTSTGSGIKQTARDKANRVGIRFIEFLDSDLMLKILKNRTFPDGMPGGVGYEEFVDYYAKERKFLEQFVVLEHEVFANLEFGFWLGEGAQGAALDLDVGQYPGITSSNPTHPWHRPDKTIGVAKAYVSSVGIGDRPFVSEMPVGLQNILREPWEEFGVSTGKPRNIGWMDTVALNYALAVTEVDEIALTCLDRLEELAKNNSKVGIATAYEVNQGVHQKWHVSFDSRDTLVNAKPVIEWLDPWEQTVEKDGKTLTPNAEKYISAIEDLTKRKLVIVGVGPKDEQTLIRKELF